VRTVGKFEVGSPVVTAACRERAPARVVFKLAIGAMAAALALAVAAFAAAPASAASPLSWSSPILVDAGPGHAAPSTSITGLSCPTASLCVGVDATGQVLWTSDPAANSNWRATSLKLASFTGVACPSVDMCVAVDDRGGVWSSTSPTGGSGSWTRSVVDARAGFTGVSCPSVSLCVATDDVGGNVVWSTDPTGGAGAWNRSLVEPLDKGVKSLRTADIINGISCPSTSLCVAVDSDGQVLTSTDPTGGSLAWTRTLIDTGSISGLSGVSCASPTQCILMDGFSGALFRSTDPTNPYLWASSQLHLDTVLTTIACPTTEQCVLGDLDGGLYTLPNANTGVHGLHYVRADGDNIVLALSCTSLTMCLAGDGAGNVTVGATLRAPTRVPRLLVNARQLNGVVATRHAGRVSFDSGLGIGCPRGGRRCSVRAIAGISGSGEIAGVAGAIRPGRRRELSFAVTRRGAKALNRQGPLGLVEIEVVAGIRGGARVAEATLVVVVPPPTQHRHHRAHKHHTRMRRAMLARFVAALRAGNLVP
jgi:hypothetical protein